MNSSCCVRMTISTGPISTSLSSQHETQFQPNQLPKSLPTKADSLIKGFFTDTILTHLTYDRDCRVSWSWLGSEL